MGNTIAWRRVAPIRNSLRHFAPQCNSSRRNTMQRKATNHELEIFTSSQLGSPPRPAPPRCAKRRNVYRDFHRYAAPCCSARLPTSHRNATFIEFASASQRDSQRRNTTRRNDLQVFRRDSSRLNTASRFATQRIVCQIYRRPALRCHSSHHCSVLRNASTGEPHAPSHV